MTVGGRSPIRTCIGCKQRRAKDALLRFALSPTGPRVDLSQRDPGRGVYLCARRLCFELAVKRGRLLSGQRHKDKNRALAAGLLMEQVLVALRLERQRLLGQGGRDGRVGLSRLSSGDIEVSDLALRRRLDLMAQQTATLEKTF